MMKYLGVVLLIVAFLLCISSTKIKKIVKINETCKSFIEYVRSKGDDKELSRIFTVPFKIESLNRRYDVVGVTLDGGKEVAVCTEGEMNDIIHVVIHELAHVARNDIEHDDAYWAVQSKLNKYAIEGGFYTSVGKSRKFCGKVIGDA